MYHRNEDDREKALKIAIATAQPIDPSMNRQDHYGHPSQILQQHNLTSQQLDNNRDLPHDDHNLANEYSQFLEVRQNSISISHYNSSNSNEIETNKPSDDEIIECNEEN